MRVCMQCAAIECADGVKLYVYVSYALKAVIQFMTHDLSTTLHQCSDMPKDKHRTTFRMQAPSQLAEVCTQYVPMCVSSPIRLLVQCVCIRLDASRSTSMRKLARVHPVLQREHHHRERPQHLIDFRSSEPLQLPGGTGLHVDHRTSE